MTNENRDLFIGIILIVIFTTIFGLALLYPFETEKHEKCDDMLSEYDIHFQFDNIWRQICVDLGVEHTKNELENLGYEKHEVELP